MVKAECKKKGAGISAEIADALVLHTYPGITPHTIGKLTHRQYHSLVGQAYNLKNFDLNGKLETETQKDKQQRIRDEYKLDK